MLQTKRTLMILMKKIQQKEQSKNNYLKFKIYKGQTRNLMKMLSPKL